MKLIKSVLVALSLSTLAAQGALASPKPVWSLEGFNEPESVLPVPGKDQVLVSNINGHPMENNGQGYISLVSTDGKVITKEWVTGLGAPKGMWMVDNLVYVADLQTLHIIDYTQGKLVKSITTYDSVMLNDITADADGTVYISDLLGGGVYRYKNHQLEKWISTEAMPHPNGLFFHKNKLVLASWGEGLKDDFSTDKLGGLYEVNTQKGSLSPYKPTLDLGNLDGVTEIDDHLIISDWINGNIFSYKHKKAKLLFNAGKHSADIGAKDNLLFVPVMFSQRIDVYEVTP